MENLLKKSKKLTGYLYFVLEEINKENKILDIITPNNEDDRGCQLSVVMLQKGKQVFDALKKHGVLSDWREPDVIRFAPVPLYNTFQDVYQLGQIVKHLTANV
jgi:kynureninase